MNAFRLAWSNLKQDLRRTALAVLGVGVAVAPTALERTFKEPAAGVFHSEEEMARDAATLARIGTVFIDSTSRQEYGDPHTWAPGTVNEINGRQVVIAGQVTIGTGFAYNG